jgi:hypothetical protein
MRRRWLKRHGLWDATGGISQKRLRDRRDVKGAAHVDLPENYALLLLAVARPLTPSAAREVPDSTCGGAISTYARAGVPPTRVAIPALRSFHRAFTRSCGRDSAFTPCAGDDSAIDSILTCEAKNVSEP